MKDALPREQCFTTNEVFAMNAFTIKVLPPMIASFNVFQLKCAAQVQSHKKKASP
jgi:hypothetical protein